MNILRRGCRPALGFVLLAAFLLPLAGCGKKALPQPPPGEPNTYPKTYPAR